MCGRKGRGGLREGEEEVEEEAAVELAALQQRAECGAEELTEKKRCVHMSNLVNGYSSALE